MHFNKLCDHECRRFSLVSERKVVGKFTEGAIRPGLKDVMIVNRGSKNRAENKTNRAEKILKTVWANLPSHELLTV